MQQQGLYKSTNEHDGCGVGFIAHIKGIKRHDIITQGLLILKNLDHRGAVGADQLMGDGAGILIQIPDQFYREEMAQQHVILPPEGEYGVGMVFLPKESASRLACEQALERAVIAEGQILLGWRDVPVSHDMPMSPTVRAKEPVIRQIFIGRGPDVIVTDALERKLYVIRKSSGHAIQALNLLHGKEFFVPSMSARTIVYKGLLLADQVGTYYLDLQDTRCLSALAMVHQRFSTNTFPEWPLAHPYRLIAHNGEINTVKGNFNWMRAREGVMQSSVLGDDLKKLFPLIYEGQSDTACFDNVLELLLMAGYPLAQAMMMMIPEAWENHANMENNRRAFYEYHAAMMEPWDGPSAVVFTDGRQIGGMLDRNGLRPARYIVTDDDLVVLASESGVLPIAESKIIKKWRLQPGKILLIDLEAGKIIDDSDIKNNYANAKPYRQWTKSVRIKLANLAVNSDTSSDISSDKHKTRDTVSLLNQQQAFGYTQEDIKFILQPIATTGEEAIGSMGNDSPLAVMSNKNKVFYNYFKQLFAQVTNPPIDPIREAMVMSLLSFIGPKPNLLDTNNVNPPMRLEVSQPILSAEDIAKLRNISNCTSGKFKPFELSICYPVIWGKAGIEAGLASICAYAVDAVKSGHNILILTDKDMDKDQLAIPALLATSAVHLHLVSKGLRTQAGLVVETGSARETHHFALLAGFGAEAIHPFLALATIVDLSTKLSAQEAIENYQKAICKGLMKVMSKMGISTYRSYCGAQIFEALGLAQDFIDKYFKGTSSNIGGIGIFEVAEEALRLHNEAFGNDPLLENALDIGGEYAFRAQGENHMWTPETIAKLQHATRSNHFNTYKEYAELINNQAQKNMTIRGLFEFKIVPKNIIPVADVEAAAEIVKRFVTGAMSLGSISTEAHATLAIAMNRIGGKSNTGEGGEDSKRYKNEMHGVAIGENESLSSILGSDQIKVDLPLRAGDSLRSKIKQVASGRFGVSAEYLSSADQIQIKMAQGAKPGEGGQLPGGKVSEYIGRLRYSVPGVGLISPPPHHDIYSIEDLSQLIHDLKNVNPRASISVKLVSETGVGTIAAGVAKAKADHIVIAGSDGGTGASPLASIKHAGSSWELGLAETQQTLVLNGLRSRIRLQVDGQLKTGRDVVIGALLGADEFGFATAPLVTQGCIMMRKCHLNTCPVGVATQDPILRAKFSGKPEYLINFLFFVAEEARQIMAQLGIAKFDDLIGRSDLLNQQTAITHWKAQYLDFSKILYQDKTHQYLGTDHFHTQTQDHGLDKALDHKLIAQARVSLENPTEKVSFITEIKNLNRSVGAMLSGELVRRYGHEGLPDDNIHIQLNGTAGQSVAAFLAKGITIDLVGEGNDYVGKGLSGGIVIVRPNPQFRGNSEQNIIVGNTVLYGAIAGAAFFKGVAGERFAVRNSGATAVVEGVGDHCCEYMTGGIVVVLGATGRNFAAGMSGGIAYVYNPHGDFEINCNPTMVSLEPVLSDDKYNDDDTLRQLIERHFQYTGSTIARSLLDNWALARSQFVKVFPLEYKRVLENIKNKHTDKHLDNHVEKNVKKHVDKEMLV
ncbi:glutamate synthase large subunit [Gammaproteobacteria bacterium]|nr:glutamate synthase large subunit [Gammaproteobacteria bacterium]